MNKELIKTRFQKKLSTYNEHANIQNTMAEKLLSYLEKREYNNILEIGCGGGLLTEKINSQLKFERYIANDIVKECKNFIIDINPEIEFYSGDIENCINNLETNFDLIISNACFQWINDIEEFLKKLCSKLNNGGILLFSTFGKENFREMFFVTDKGLNYYCVSELEQMLKNYEAKIEEEIRIMSFKTSKDVIKHIHYTGVNAVESKFWTKKDLADFENSYNNFCSNHPTLTYNPIYVMLKKH